VSWIRCFGEYFAGWGSMHMQSWDYGAGRKYKDWLGFNKGWGRRVELKRKL
jgi:hypothetical protein